MRRLDWVLFVSGIGAGFVLGCVFCTLIVAQQTGLYS